MSERKVHPVKNNGNKSKKINVNDLLTHPFAASEKGAQRDRFKYKFLRVTRLPTLDRPDSGRVLVENVATGQRTEHYGLLFGISFGVI